MSETFISETPYRWRYHLFRRWAREHPDARYPWPSLAELAEWASQFSDDEVLTWYRIGPTTLRQIRAIAPGPDKPPIVKVCRLCGRPL